MDGSARDLKTSALAASGRARDLRTSVLAAFATVALVLAAPGLVALVLAAPDLAYADAALVYHGDSDPVTPTTDERALAIRVAATLTWPGSAAPTLDKALVRAARQLTRAGNPRGVLSAAGVSDAFAMPMTWVAMDGVDVLSPVHQLLNSDVKRARPTHFGVGMVGSGSVRRVGLVFVRRGADLSRFPRYVETGDQFMLNGTLAPGLKRPLVLISQPNGRVHELRPRSDRRVFWTKVPFLAGRGRYHIEIQAENRYGVQVLNLMEVHATAPGEPREHRVVRLQPPARPVLDPKEAEERAVELINRARRIARLPGVRLDDALRAEARAHSHDMAKGGWFGHVSPTRGGLAKRLRRACLKPPLARENVALAPTPELAHAELVRSPSHLRNILDPDVTHVGVGAHRQTEQPVFTFTQIFAQLTNRR